MERQARRAQVLRHAKRIFARKGYHRTNVADIIARARIARGTFYLYFQNKKDLFEELLEQAVTELTQRIQRLRPGPDEPDPVDQLRANLTRVLSYAMAERELTDILLNHSTGFDHELDDKIQDFYDRIAALIKRSLDLGIEMNLVRNSDTRAVSYAILGGIKEVDRDALAQRRHRPVGVSRGNPAVRAERRRAARVVEIRAAAKPGGRRSRPTGAFFLGQN